MGAETFTLSSGVYSDRQPDYLLSFLLEIFGFMAGCCGAKQGMEPPHFTVTGQCAKVHRGRFLCWHGQAERALQATYRRVSFTKGICGQAPSPGTAPWPWEAEMLLTGGGALHIQHVTAEPVQNPELRGRNRTCTWWSRLFRHTSPFPLL